MTGKTISHHIILDKLGEGGMGVVYKAEDTKLDRIVAIKFLPRQVAANEENRKRFEIEAKAAAALNHPSIATIHAIQEADDEIFIVMEYLEGRELREIISGYQDAYMPLDEIVNYATAVAEGLQAAHEKGVIHRDIKSANIMITEKAQAKIMDFGLAKVRGATQITKEHSTLGTVSYMSPEQALGEDTDHRTDIWSFGVVLFEMLTGQMPFPGERDSVILHAIIYNEPASIADKREDVAFEIEQITYKCLQKDKEHRYQSAEHLLTGLKKLKKNIESGKSGAQAGQPPVKARKRVPRSILFAATLVLVGAFFVIGYNLFQKESGEPKTAQMRILTPTSVIREMDPALSPDGMRIAYVSNENGNNDIWVQQITSGDKINLTKDYEGEDNMPAWSADGDWIAFRSERNDGGIFIMSALGGHPRQVATHRGDPGWSPDGTKLVYSYAGKMYLVALNSGAAVHIPLPHSVMEPSWSPDGNRIVYRNYSDSPAIWTINPDGSDAVVVIEGPDIYQNPIWGHDGKSIFFKSNRGGIRDIWWIPVNQKGRATGSARPVTIGSGVYKFSLSQDGSRIAYFKSDGVQVNIWSIPIRSDHILTMQDAHRITSEKYRKFAWSGHLAISPDHEWLAFDSNRSGNMDIWLMRKDGRDIRQLTKDMASDAWPTWSPDGSQIAFQSDRSGNWDIYIMPVGGGNATGITHGAANDAYPVWSPVGDDIIFASRRSGNWDIWAVSVGSGDLRQLTTDEAFDRLPTWSPDGRYISFFSSRTDAGDLFVLPVDGREAMQLTDFGNISNFGVGAWLAEDARSAWSLDGKTIYMTYESEPEDPGRDIWAISVEGGSMRKVLDFKSGGLYGFLTGVRANDGEKLYFSEKNFASDIWLAELEYE